MLHSSHFCCPQPQQPQQCQRPRSRLGVKPHLLIRREMEGVVFIINAYWILGFFFKSIHQLSCIHNLLSLGRNPRLREVEPVDQDCIVADPDLARPLSHIILGSRFCQWDKGGQLKLSKTDRDPQFAGNPPTTLF